MRYLSLFSGIEAASVAWSRLGWVCAAVSEIEPAPCKILAERYPDVPNLGDVTKITEEQVKALGQLDLIVFGSPCQDLSVAGKRKGLKGERSGLFIDAVRIIGWARKHCGLRYALWENVPGSFSSNKGRDFAEVVKALAGLDHLDPPHYGWGTEGAAVGDDGMLEWAVLDAQWFGLAQRRRRVFALADYGDWAGRAPILLEPHSLRGDTAPSRETKENPTRVPARGIGNGGTHGGSVECANAEGSLGPPFLTASNLAKCVNNQTFLLVVHGTQDPDIKEELAHTLGCNNGQENAVVYGGSTTVVRRFTEKECERLQGFLDDWTKVTGVSSTERYRALGNSMAVEVMHYIGQRISTGGFA